MEQKPDFSQLMKLAQSPAGKQLFSLLQRSGGKDLQTAVDKASSGDYDQAKKILSSLLSNSEAQALLKQMEDSL